MRNSQKDLFHIVCLWARIPRKEILVHVYSSLPGKEDADEKLNRCIDMPWG